MQNNSTGMLATSVPVDVVPSAPRWPSWKIHTSAPNAAVSDKTLSTNAFSGNTTLPVSRNSSTNVIAAMTPRTSRQPRRDRLRAVAVDLRDPGQLHRTVRPAGSPRAAASSWASEASVNSGAVLPTVRNALPSLHPGGRRRRSGGPAADERAAGRRHRRHVGHLRQRRGVVVQFGGRARRRRPG